jgi:hypothetical protein
VIKINHWDLKQGDLATFSNVAMAYSSGPPRRISYLKIKGKTRFNLNPPKETVDVSEFDL